MREETVIHKAGGVIIRERSFLVVRARGKDIFVAPGGKLELGETAAQALIRELMEETQIEVVEKNLEEVGVFTAKAAGNESQIVIMEVFLVNQYSGHPIPTNEVEELQWINSKTTGLNIGSIFEHNVMPILLERRLID